MTPFEDELRRALARHEPSEEFTARVLASTTRRADERQRSLKMPRLEWRFAWVMALVLLFVCGLAYRQHVRTRQGEAAKKQLLMAMHIAGEQLHEAQLRVKRIQFPEMVMQ